MITTHEAKDPAMAEQRLINLISALKRKEILSLIIEPTGMCNLACNFCPMHNGSLETEHLKKHMTDATWGACKDAIASLNYKVNMIQFHGYGEPLLNKKLYQMIKDVRPYCRTVRVISNGVALNESRHRRILEAGADEVHISLDVMESDRYEQVKGRDEFHRVVDNIFRSFYLYDEFRDKNLFIKLAKPMDELEGQWGENSVRKSDFDIAYDKLSPFFVDAPNRHLKVMGLFTTYEGHEMFEDEKPCEMPFYMVKVNYRGDIDLCCASIFGETSVGNVRECGLQIHDRAKAIRLAQLSGAVSQKIPMCGSCGAKTVVDVLGRKQEIMDLL